MGPPHLLSSISVNGSPFYATKGLETTLVQLRLPNAVRKVWVNAVSINQNDIEERGQQVSMMKDIYAQANEVIIWLGKKTRTSERVIKFL
jgi:hypothetical protein